METFFRACACVRVCVTSLNDEIKGSRSVLLLRTMFKLIRPLEEVGGVESER